MGERGHKIEMSDKLHAPAALPAGKVPLVSIGQVAGLAPESVCKREQGKTNPTHVRNRHFVLWGTKRRLTNTNSYRHNNK